MGKDGILREKDADSAASAESDGLDEIIYEWGNQTECEKALKEYFKKEYGKKY